MRQHLRRFGPLFRIVAQHPFHQADSLWRSARNNRLQIDLLVFGHRKHLAISQSFGIRPIIGIGLAKNLGNFLELVHLGRAREQRFERVELRHDAPKREDVDWVVVRPAAEHVLWGAVPTGRHILCEWSWVAYLFDKAEIAEFNSRLFIDEHIFRFNVSMEETVIVDVVEGGGDLLDDVSDLLVGKRVVVELAHLHHAVQIHVQQFKQHVECVLMADHFLTSYNVRVLQPNHRFHFRVAHGDLPRRELAFEGLQCVDLLRRLVSHLVHDSEATLAQSFQNSESFDQQRSCWVRLHLIARCHVLES